MNLCFSFFPNECSLHNIFVALLPYVVKVFGLSYQSFSRECTVASMLFYGSFSTTFCSCPLDATFALKLLMSTCASTFGCAFPPCENAAIQKRSVKHCAAATNDYYTLGQSYQTCIHYPSKNLEGQAISFTTGKRLTNSCAGFLSVCNRVILMKNNYSISICLRIPDNFKRFQSSIL